MAGEVTGAGCKRSIRRFPMGPERRGGLQREEGAAKMGEAVAQWQAVAFVTLDNGLLAPGASLEHLRGVLRRGPFFEFSLDEMCDFYVRCGEGGLTRNRHGATKSGLYSGVSRTLNLWSSASAAKRRQSRAGAGATGSAHLLNSSRNSSSVGHRPWRRAASSYGVACSTCGTVQGSPTASRRGLKALRQADRTRWMTRAAASC